MWKLLINIPQRNVGNKLFVCHWTTIGDTVLNCLSCLLKHACYSVLRNASFPYGVLVLGSYKIPSRLVTLHCSWNMISLLILEWSISYFYVIVHIPFLNVTIMIFFHFFTQRILCSRNHVGRGNVT